MDYKGVIVEESLINTSIIKELELFSKEVEKTSEDDNTPWLTQWTLDTVIIKEDKIDDYTKRLSKLIDDKHCSDWYCDFKNDKYHYVVFKDKIFKLRLNNKEDYQKMQEYARSIGLIEAQIPNYFGLDENLLKSFLIYAKKMTYANSDAPVVQSSRKGSRDYEFKEVIEGEEMLYHDTFFGGTHFMGEEVVYRGEGGPKWGMNYYGNTLDSSLSEEAMDNALRPALMLVGEDKDVLPVRGLKEYKNGLWEYHFTSNGDIFNFEGREEVYYDGRKVYELICYGGLIE